MILYSYHILNSEQQEISGEQYQALPNEEKQQVSIRVKRHEKRGENVKVLSLVGGGIRGFMIGKALEAIEEASGKRIAEIFDVIVGTSTGAPITFALSYPKEVSPEDIVKNPDLSNPHPAKPKFPAKMITKIYSHYGPYIFANPHLKRVLDEYIGTEDYSSLSVEEIDEIIEIEGSVIHATAECFKESPSVKDAYFTLEGRISTAISIMKNMLGIKMENSFENLDIDEFMSSDEKAKIIYSDVIKPKLRILLQEKLEKNVENPVVIEQIQNILTEENIIAQFSSMNSFFSNEVKVFMLKELEIELQNQLLNPLNQLKDSLYDYEKYSYTIFEKTGIERVISRFIPKNAVIEDFLGCVAATACERDSLELKVLDNLSLESRNITAQDAILAAVSAQTYFPSQNINGVALIDAGAAVKNPSKVGLVLAKKYFNEAKVKIFEIGTGITEKIERINPHSLVRIANPSESIGLVMETGKNSTSKSLEGISINNENLEYSQLDFELKNKYLDNTNPDYFKEMLLSVKDTVEESSRWNSFISSLLGAENAFKVKCENTKSSIYANIFKWNLSNKFMSIVLKERIRWLKELKKYLNEKQEQIQLYILKSDRFNSYI